MDFINSILKKYKNREGNSGSQICEYCEFMKDEKNVNLIHMQVLNFRSKSLD